MAPLGLPLSLLHRGTANNNPSETDKDSLSLLMMNNLCLMPVMASGNSGCFWVLELLKDLC